MKKIAFFLASAAAMAAVPAGAREGRAYIGINGGLSFEDQVDLELASEDPNVNAAYSEVNPGFDGDLVVGYDFGPFRLEAEGGYKKAAFDGVTIIDPAILPSTTVIPLNTRFSAAGDLQILSGMLNGMFEVGKDDGLQLFAGGGVGFANVEVPITATDLGQVIDTDGTDLAYQAIAGARFAVTDNIDIGLKYRYFVIDGFDVESLNGDPVELEYDNHSVLASLTYNFGSSPAPAPIVVAPPVVTPPPPPPPVVVAPPPPKPVCNTGPYIVFFEFDKSDITAEAATILNNAATAYANCGMARVMLAGHTDTSGRASYNMALAERRNDAVRSYLTGRGIAAAKITGEAFGESMPRVPTADGVREAQNRRVEVTYGPGSGM